jgi:glyoxylase-like metal-dependent hydrolase (beta-lactamase superfamily II)
LAEVRWRKTVGPAEITKISVGAMDNNVYLIAVGDEAAVVDGGSAEVDAVLAELGDRRLTSVLQTHNHGDHIAELPDLVERAKVPVLAHPADADRIPVSTEKIDDGATVGLGGCIFKVLYTPGHTPGGVCFLLEEAGESHLFAGDTLFPGGPGNTWGRKEAFEQIMDSLETKLFVLPDSTYVYPGHGADTTIGAERPQLETWRRRGW